MEACTNLRMEPPKLSYNLPLLLPVHHHSVNCQSHVVRSLNEHK